MFDAIAVGGGFLVLSPMPGRGGDLAGDLAALQALQPDWVLSLVENGEFAQVPGLFAALQAGDLGVWLRFPIVDFGVPDAVRAALWPELCADICQRLARGERGVVHCMGGCGRTGMIVLRLMVVLGEQPDASLARLRECRACCVETEPQRLWALAQDRVG